MASIGELHVPTEILSLIFIYSDAPHELSLINRCFHQISKNPATVARHLVYNHGRLFCINRAIRSPQILTVPVFDALLNLGARFSWYLAGTAVAAQVSPTNFGVRPEHKKYLNETVVERIYGEAKERFGTIQTSELDVEAFLVWEQLLCILKGVNVNIDHEIHAPPPGLENTVEQQWLEFEKSLKERRFAPFSPTDPLNQRLARAVCLEPRLLPLLRANGWDFDREAQDALVRATVFARDPETFMTTALRLQNGHLVVSPRQEILVDELKMYLDGVKGALEISVTVVGQILLADDGDYRHELIGQSSKSAHIKILQDLERDGYLKFRLSDVAADLLRMFHHTLSDRTPQETHRVVSLLYNLIPANHPLYADPAIASVYFTNRTFPGEDIFGSAIKDLPTTDMPESVRRYGVEGAHKVFADILCDPFLTDPCPYLMALAQVNEPYIDLVEVTRLTALAYVRLPAHGAPLLRLVSINPSLKNDVREEILRHRIDISRLRTMPQEPWRPVYTLDPHFLSPIAFDYSEAFDRYPTGLGPHPWVEDAYATPLPPQDPHVSSSCWPLRPKKYEVVGGGEGGSSLDLGCVDGSSAAWTRGVPSGSHQLSTSANDKWLSNRVCEPSLPTAIAFLDIYDVQDEALAVVLMHALLNLNAYVAAFYLKTGVPLRQSHLAAVKKLGVPQLACATKFLEEGGKVLPDKPRLSRRQRKKAKAKAEASVVRQ
ncbi:hypothetical protein MNV49_000004 [Pseudohyphozyma bogoriensis]|nr:hypothetical protein MNV49_000004 [Pseudohyphozyma bogoriensis]